MERDPQELVSPWVPGGEGADRRERHARLDSAGMELSPLCHGELLRFSSRRTQSSLDSRKRTSSNVDSGMEGEEAYRSTNIYCHPPKCHPLYSMNPFKKGRQ